MDLNERRNEMKQREKEFYHRIESQKETIRKLAAEALEQNDGAFNNLQIHDEFNKIYVDVCNLLHYCQVQRELDWVKKLTPIRDMLQEVIK